MGTHVVSLNLFDFANHLVWLTPYPELEFAEEIYRKLVTRVGERTELRHNLALTLLLQGRADEGAELIRDLRHRSEAAVHNLRLLETGQDVNPRDLRIMTILHGGLQTLPPTVPAWQTRVTLDG